jgi:hypothetical protein
MTHVGSQRHREKIIIKSISTIMYMVWLVEKYKIIFKLIISNWTNKMSFSTHSRILFSSEYFHYKILINVKCLKTKMTTSRRTSRGPV